MVVERRIVAGVRDLKAILFECNKCKTRTCHSPDSAPDIPYRCACGHQWRQEPGERPTPAVEHHEPYFVRFVKAIQTLRLLEKENPLGFTILFEFEEPR